LAEITHARVATLWRRYVRRVSGEFSAVRERRRSKLFTVKRKTLDRAGKIFTGILKEWLMLLKQVYILNNFIKMGKYILLIALFAFVGCSNNKSKSVISLQLTYVSMNLINALVTYMLRFTRFMVWGH
jgi:hypothetical protein